MARQYSTYDSIIDFSRASTATHRDVDGIVRLANIDEPRIDYDQSGNRLGLLLEPSRTNLLPYSNSFSSWSSIRAVVEDGNEISPANESSASTLYANADTPYSYVIQNNITTDTTLDHCFSIFYKGGQSDKVRLAMFTPTLDGFEQNFGLSNSYSNTYSLFGTASLIDSGVEPYRDGWYRCWVSFTPSTTDSGSISTIYFQVLDNDFNQDARGLDPEVPAAYAWGAQLELGRRPSSVIYTEGAAVTRAIDYADIPVDAFRYSSNSGTIVLTARCSDYQQFNTRLVNLGATSSEGLDLWVRNTDTVAVYRDDVNEILAQSVAVSRDDYHNIAFSYNTDSNVGGLAVNGVTHSYSNVISDVSSVSTIQLNREATNNGTAGIVHIKDLSYYPRALSLDYIGDLTRV